MNREIFFRTPKSPKGDLNSHRRNFISEWFQNSLLVKVKYTALILLFCIVGLTVQPILPHVSTAKCRITKVEKNCCAMKHPAEKQEHKQKKDDCCSNGPCSFFGGSCGCCLGSCPPTLAFKFRAFPVIKVLNAHINQFASSNHTREDFHPPELGWHLWSRLVFSVFFNSTNHYKMKKIIYSALAIVLISGTAAVAAINHSGKEKATCTCTKCSCTNTPSCVCTK